MVIGAKLIGVSDQEKRTIFTFDNPKNPGYEIKFSAFKPNVPNLIIGKRYDFPAEHKPTGDGKFYHNLTRKTKDGDYQIKESSILLPAPMGKEDPVQAKLQPEYKSPQNEYWEGKTAHDKLNSARICRQACINAAIEFSKQFQGRTISEDDIIKSAVKFEAWVKGAKI